MLLLGTFLNYFQLLDSNNFFFDFRLCLVNFVNLILFLLLRLTLPSCLVILINPF